jgi:predicted nucleic acid-binding protein
MKKDKVKVYLDTSVYNRPFDDQGQTRIRLESEAFLSIVEKAILGSISIIGSSILAYENTQNPFVHRKERVLSYLSVATRNIRLNNFIRKKALLLEDIGIDPLDALHIACAEFGGAEYFITCDDDVIKKAKKHREIVIIDVCNPLEFVLEEVFKDA